MDKNTPNLTNFSSDLSPKLTPKLVQNSLLKKRQKSWIRRWGFFVFPILTIVVAIISYGVYTKLFALSNPYTPDMGILDPGCAPTDPNCFVQIYPNQAGQNGKILSTDGTNTTWTDNNGGPFTGGAVSQTGWTGVSNTNYTSTSLRDFISQVFFPAANPTVNSLSAIYEIGDTTRTNFTFSLVVTRKTNAVTSITITPSSSSGTSPKIQTLSSDSPASTLSSGVVTVGSSTYSPTPLGSGGASGNTFVVSRPTSLICSTSHCDSYNGTNATFSISVSDGTLSGSGSATFRYYPYVYIGTSATNFMDSVAFPDDSSVAQPTLYNSVKALTSKSLQASRTVSLTTFNAQPGNVDAGKYVYFAFPSYDATAANYATNHFGPFTTYDPSITLSSSCISTTPVAFSGTGGVDGGVDCFYDDNATGTDHGFIHRTMHNFVNGGNPTNLPISYELYRSPNPLTSGFSSTYRVN